MYKKCVVVALFFISQVDCSNDAYKAGGLAAKEGIQILEGVLNELNKPENAQALENVGRLAVKGIGAGLLKGGGDLFEEGNEFDTFVDKGGDAGRRAMLLGMNKTGEGIAEAFAKGGEWDQGVTAAKDLGIGHANDIVQRIGIYNLLKFGGVSLGIVAAYYAIPVLARLIERELLNPRPKLIIESSKNSIIQQYTSLFSSKQLPAEMVFSPDLKLQLDDIAKVTTMINKKIKDGKTNVKYRNLMLYGPPGTGKTMFAKELAKKSGLEYAFMSGSSFSKFKDGEGIIALDELFAWAKRSKGLMIFIDEAETFLSKRDNMDPQSKAYQLLNNFLNYTGERSSQFMIVFATNHKEALDSAMYRRIDDLIEMPLPSKQQRINTLILYKNKILLDLKQNEIVFVDSVNKELNDDTIQSIAEKTKGLSYGDLEGIINTLKTDTDILEPAIINPKLIQTVVDRAVKKHKTFTNGKLLGTVED